MRLMNGAEKFLVIRPYRATATRNDIAWPDARTRAAHGSRIPRTG